jgi:N-acetylglucosaminyldiphosphoundecaprenol N-acetyl-beta-D-mannosaminyltransferase
MTRYKLIGVNVDSISEDEIYDKILKLTELERPSQIILLDTYLLVKSFFDKELLNIINSSDLVIPISPMIKHGLKFLNKKIEKIYNYFSFLITLLLKFSDYAKFVYILGGKKKYIDKVTKNIKDSFPGIRLVGTYHSHYKKNFENDLIVAIQKANPALMYVGMKSPRQEKWIYKKKGKFYNGVFIGVGDFIDIICGKGDAPTDKTINSGSHSLKKTFRRPFMFINYIIFFILLLISKLTKS